MSGYPDLRPSSTGVYPPSIYMVPKGVPVLGEHMIGSSGKGLLMGWVPFPADEWQPEDLIWTPPGTKSLDLAGSIAEVKTPDDSAHAWVVAELSKSRRYWDMVRERVLKGTFRLTPALAKMLGMRFDDAVGLEDRDGNTMGVNRLAQLMAAHLKGAA